MIGRAFYTLPAGAVKPGQLVLSEKGRIKVENINISVDGVGLVGVGLDRAKQSRTKHTAQPSELVTVVATDKQLDAIETAVLAGEFDTLIDDDGHIGVRLDDDGPTWMIALRDGVTASRAGG